MDKQEKKTERRITFEILGIVAFAFFLVVVFVGTQQIIKWNNNFTYHGLAFTKTRVENLQVYHYYYNWVDEMTQKSYQYNLYLRKDPRKNTVEIIGTPELATRTVYLTLNLSSPLTECNQSSLAIGDLALFLQQNQLTVNSGVTTEEAAVETNSKVVTCESKPDREVIEITRGDRTVVDVGTYCTRIIVGPDCNVLDATEKFKVELISAARQRSLGGGVYASASTQV